MKNLDVSLLLDFYGETLTEKQRTLVGYYYNDDLSLSEIASNEGITRQGVRDAIKRAETQLYEMEAMLGLLGKARSTEEALNQITALCEKIREYNLRYNGSREIEGFTGKITEIVGEIKLRS